MVPTPHSSVVSYLLLSGLVGFAVFCGSYGYHVWKRRNHSVSSRAATHPLVAMLRRLSVVLAILGGLSIVAALILREVIFAEGVVAGEQIFTLRSRKSEAIERLTGKKVVQQGELIARFASPVLDAEFEAARLQKLEHEAERARLQSEPLEPDPELVRRQQNVLSKQSQLRASRDQIFPARELLARQQLQDFLEKRERLAQINVTLGVTRGGLEEAKRERTYSFRELVRMEEAGKRNAVTASEEDRHRKNVSVLDAEIAKLVKQVDDLESEKQQLEASVKAMSSLTEKQLAIYDAELQTLKENKSQSSADDQALAAKLAEDQRRAAAARAEDLRRLAMKIGQAEAKMAGVEQQRTVRAPADGKVHFRESAPQSANEGEPLLVIGPEAGFRLRLRMRDPQARALEKEDELAVELINRHVEPRLTCSQSRQPADQAASVGIFDGQRRHAHGAEPQRNGPGSTWTNWAFPPQRT